MWKIQEDKRIIEFEIAGYNSQIFISVRNSYDMESIINQKQKFITTKEDKLNHGIGLENVRRTVKKYKLSPLSRTFWISVVPVF